MRGALAGRTGLIGSHMLADLQERGHRVTAPVRAETQAHSGKAGSATPIVIDGWEIEGSLR